jgi:hypothetical protein
MKKHISMILIVVMAISYLAIGGSTAEAGVVAADSCDDLPFWPQSVCTRYCETLDCESDIPQNQILRQWLCKYYEFLFHLIAGNEPPCDPCNENQADTDDDGHVDVCDNCPSTSNEDQADSDGDGIGDECDPDADGDGVLVPEDCNDSDSDIRPNLPGEMRSDFSCDGVDIDCSQPYGGCEPKENCPETCFGLECGRWDAGCGVFVDCGENMGDCNPGGIGFDTCVGGQCCTPTVTECRVLNEGGSCGNRIDNGCGSTIPCTCQVGNCVEGHCDDGAFGCVPISCDNVACGTDDLCGGFCPGSCPAGEECLNFGSGYFCGAITIQDCNSIECGFCMTGSTLMDKSCPEGKDCTKFGQCEFSTCNRPCNQVETCNKATGECECCDGLYCTTCDPSISVCLANAILFPQPGDATCCLLNNPVGNCFR